MLLELIILDTDVVTYCTEARAVIVENFDITYHRSNEVSGRGG
jgi:hypothetical protein